jgi:FtsZ-binding cell division protein ZapB
MLTDKEYRHYQELYNMDPVVQRLCKIDHERLAELEDEIEELKEQVEILESDLEFEIDEKRALERENTLLREKIQVWNTLEKE